MTQPTSSLTSTAASLLTSNAHAALRWQMPDWTTATAASNGGYSFSQMLANIGRSATDATAQETASRSVSRTTTRSRRSGTSSGTDSRSDALTDPTDQPGDWQDSLRASPSESAANANEPSRSRRGETTSNTPENRSVSASDADDPASAEMDDPGSSQELASADSPADGTDPAASSDDSDSSSSTDKVDSKPAKAHGQTAAKESTDETGNVEFALALSGNRLAADSSLLSSVAIAPTGQAAQANTKAEATASTATNHQAKAQAAVSELAVHSTTESNPTANLNQSGFAAGGESLATADSGAKLDPKAQIKAEFAPKLSEHRPVETLMQTLSEKKSSSLATGSTTLAHASTGTTGELQESADQSNIAQVARGLQNAFKQGGGSVTLRLTPAELGSIKVQLAVQDGVVQAKFTAESQAAGDLLTHQMDQLRQALQKQGLHVDRLEVQMPANASTQASNLPDRSSSDSQDPAAWSNEGRSRGQMQDSAQQQQRQDRSNPAEPAPSFGDLLNTTA